MTSVTLLPADIYQLVNKCLLNDYDKLVLSMLYMPIIGNTAITLYNTFYNELKANNYMSNELTHHHLVTNLGESLENIKKARIKLEGIGLLKTYVMEGNVNSYVYELYSPLTVSEFFNHPIFSTVLKNNVGDVEFKRLKNYFKVPKLNLKDYVDITHPFDLTFKSVNIENFKEDDEVLKKEKNSLNYSYEFDFDTLISSMPKGLFNPKALTKSIKELMQYAVDEAGDRDAFRYKKGKDIVSVTYHEFQKDTLSLGVALHKLGMDGKHIAVIGENSYDWLTVYLTALKSKSVLVPIDKELPLKDIINVLKHSDSELLFYSGRYEKHIREISNALPQVKYFIGFEKEDDESDSNLSYKKFINSGRELYEKEGYEEPDIDTNAMKVIIYTSGTTGMAKGVMLSEHNLLSVAIGALKITKIQKSCLSVLPYHHTYESRII